MSIQSASEFEAVINQVTMRIERVITERGSVPPLETALRDLQRIFKVARDTPKLKALRGVLEQVTDLVTEHVPNDNALLEQFWDLGDFVDYRA